MKITLHNTLEFSADWHKPYSDYTCDFDGITVENEDENIAISICGKDANFIGSLTREEAKTLAEILNTIAK